MELAESCLEAASLLLGGGFCAEAVDLAWRSMACVIRGLLAAAGAEGAGEEALVACYREKVLPGLEVSPENRRLPVIVRNLWEKMFIRGEEEGDPLTARACLKDARGFLSEMRDKRARLAKRREAEGPPPSGRPGERPPGDRVSRGTGNGEPACTKMVAPGEDSMAGLARLLLELGPEAEGSGGEQPPSQGL
jgi:hypothetical protein